MTIDGRLFVASSSDGHGFAEAPPFRDDLEVGWWGFMSISTQHKSVSVHHYFSCVDYLRGHHYPPSRAPIHSGVALANNVNGRPAAPARVLQWGMLAEREV